MSAAQTMSRPLVVQLPESVDTSSLSSWLADSEESLRGKLDQFGAILLRGLPLHEVRDFAAVRDQFLRSRTEYREKATPRHSYGDDVLSSTDLPASQVIRLHNENSYTLTFPTVLLFGCLVPPTTGGATPVGSTEQLVELLPPELVARFESTGWLLRRTYSEHLGLPWRIAFGTEDRDVVESYCAANLIGTEWDDDGTLHTTQRRPALIRQPGTSRRLWFNHAAFWNEWSLEPEVRQVLVDDLGAENLPFNTAYGDGTPISEAEIAVINAAYDRVTVREPWHAGDLLVVDNLLCAHGRESFTGPREIVVAMGEPVDVLDCAPTIHPTTGMATS